MSLFASSNVSTGDSVLDVVEEVIPTEENAQLLKPILETEIREADF